MFFHLRNTRDISAIVLQQQSALFALLSLALLSMYLLL